MDVRAATQGVGEIVGEMVGVKRRIHPPKFGIGCFIEATLADDAVEKGRKIISDLGYRGFVSLQFKRDERNGELYLLEVNLRLPIWINLPIKAGLPFPYFYYLTCMNMPFPENIKLKVGKKWMNLRQDFSSMKTYAKKKQAHWLQWWIDLLARPAFPIFVFFYPGPALVITANWLSKGFSRRLKGILPGAFIDKEKQSEKAASR